MGGGPIAAVVTEERRPSSTVADAGVGADVALVLAALAAATFGQGGYYRRVSTVAAVLLAFAAAALFARRRFATLRLAGWALAGLGGMFATTLVTGVIDGHPASALGPLALITGLAIIVAVVSASTLPVRRQLTDATLALGAFLAASAWVGVAFHVRPFGHSDGGLWRAATTVTYANAAAAILGPLALWALARATTRTDWTTRATAVLLLTGLGATLSRAGLASFAVGLVVLSALLGFGVLWRSIGTVVLGGLVAAVALAPGMPDPGSAKPWWAVLGLGVGLATGLVRAPGLVGPRGSAARRVRRLRLGRFALLAALAVGVAVVGFSGHGHAWSDRFSLSSPDRSSLASAALHMWHNHLVTGVGPGRAVFVWTTPFHLLLFDRYAHNEYLQVAVEQGLVGLVALGALVAAVAATAFGGWRSASRARSGSRANDPAAAELTAIRAGAIAGLICVALHSGFDFLWHVPAVPMIAALAVGLAARLETEALSQPPTPDQAQEVS